MDQRTATYRKITARLVPFLFACYILAYIDRVNMAAQHSPSRPR